VEEYLGKLTEPEKVMVVDMHEPLRQAIQMCLPHTKVVADKFHLIRHINDALDKVRSRLQGGAEGGTGKIYSSAGIFCSRELGGLLTGKGQG
jgi:transposase